MVWVEWGDWVPKWLYRPACSARQKGPNGRTQASSTEQMQASSTGRGQDTGSDARKVSMGDGMGWSLLILVGFSFSLFCRCGTEGNFLSPER